MGRGTALPGATKGSSQMAQPVARCPKAPGRGRAAWEATSPRHPLPFPAGRHRQRGLCAVQLLGFLLTSGFSGLLLALPPTESNHGAHSFQKASQEPAQPVQGS